MSNDAMLNVRLDKTLKEHGCQVLERNGASVSSLVRSAFEYMDKNQALPPDLFPETRSLASKRRRLVRCSAGAYPVADGFDFESARAEYQSARAAKTAQGVR